MSYAVRAKAVRRQVASALRESERNARKDHKDAILTMRAEARETVALALESIKKDARRKKDEAAAEKRAKANARKAARKAAVPRARKRESAKNHAPTLDLCAVELPAFARIVIEAAKSEKAVTWHGDRAFISTVWSAVDPQVRMRCSIEQFKERLVDAHRKGLLRMTRADMVRAMSDALVRESETHIGMASFHFIALD